MRGILVLVLVLVLCSASGTFAQVPEKKLSKKVEQQLQEFSFDARTGTLKWVMIETEFGEDGQPKGEPVGTTYEISFSQLQMRSGGERREIDRYELQLVGRTLEWMALYTHDSTNWWRNSKITRSNLAQVLPW